MSQSPSTPPFTHLTTYRGVGGVLNTLVGPGPHGSERLYQSHIYIGGTLEVVAVDPATGAHQVYPAPVASESGAWAMALGPDGNLYLGTLPHAHLLRLDPRSGAFVDLGRPSETEQYIWQLALAADGRLYGCTYPSAKLVRFDPATGRGEDLGRLDPIEQYARHVAASDDGFVYVGIGTSRAHLVAYHIATGAHRDILPTSDLITGTATVHRGADGRLYGAAGGQHFRLQGWQAIPLEAVEVVAPGPPRLRDGRLVRVVGDQVRLQDPSTGVITEHPFRYAGKAIDVFRLGLGPDGMLYGSSVLPLNFFRVDPGDGALTDFGTLGGGECYAFLRHGDRLLGAAYGGQAPLLAYDPRRPFQPGKAPPANPLLIEYPGQNSGWRPMAMIAAPGDEPAVYLGAIAGYGELGGPLTRWDLATNAVDSVHHLVPDQSVVSLTWAGGLLVGGTTIRGGGGSRPTQTSAFLFIWDPASRHKVFETVPVPGAPELTDLVTAPDGRVLGIAGGSTLFVFDPGTRRIDATARLPFQGVVYNGAAVGPDGRIWGLATDGVFVVDPHTATARLIAPATSRITAGFVLDGQALYFASGPRIYRYQLP